MVNKQFQKWHEMNGVNGNMIEVDMRSYDMNN